MSTHKQRQSKRRAAASPISLAVGGVVFILLGALLGLNGFHRQTAPDPASPQSQYESARQAGQPIFLFFHSTDCHSCVVMMEGVARVFPAYEGRIVLVDVIVSEPRNRPLMESFNIRAIPTMIFIDRSGKGRIAIGPLEDAQLAAALEALLR